MEGACTNCGNNDFLTPEGLCNSCAGMPNEEDSASKRDVCRNCGQETFINSNGLCDDCQITLEGS